MTLVLGRSPVNREPVILAPEWEFLRRTGSQMPEEVGLDALLAQLDPHPGARGRQFERLCRWFLLNAPEYRGRFRRVWLWAEWPDAWGPDAGIDLVAEENDGGLWSPRTPGTPPPRYRRGSGTEDSHVGPRHLRRVRDL